MTALASKARTALALGLLNIVRASGYRLGVKLGLNPVRRLQGVTPVGPFFHPFHEQAVVAAPSVLAWGEMGRLFSIWPLALGDGPPDWLANPLTGQRVSAPERAWWEIPDFDSSVGDIKLIWEL